MAITRLTDIISVFESKWTYGDVKFGYEGEVNQDHDTHYPLMLVTPPASIMPVIYDGREEYSFEINFYNLYSQAAQSVVTLQKRWDNLQDLSNEWLDMVLKNYQDVTVEAYLNDESIEIERVKDSNNDKLVQIKLVFTMSAFTKCFRPVSNYPSDLSDLVVWLSARSGVTFDIPTKKISAWADQSGNSNSVAQGTKANQPLRYGFDGADDKSYIEFDGNNDSFTSDGNSPITSDEFTIFAVSKVDTAVTESGRYFEYVNGNIKVLFGSKNNELYGRVVDNASEEIELTLAGADTADYHIAMLKLDDKRLYLDYNNTLTTDLQNASYDSATIYDGAVFNIGVNNATDYLDGQIEELIIYNRKLESTEIADIKSYLNKEYNIY